MTEPIYKALDLVNKFAIYLRANLMYDEDADEDAKQCALIATDEIIELLWHTHKNIDEYNFWKDVKQELEKL